MANAKYETTTVNIAAGDYTFRVSTSKVAFDGFMLAYTEADDEKQEKQHGWCLRSIGIRCREAPAGKPTGVWPVLNSGISAAVHWAAR